MVVKQFLKLVKGVQWTCGKTMLQAEESAWARGVGNVSSVYTILQRDPVRLDRVKEGRREDEGKDRKSGLEHSEPLGFCETTRRY